ncbi:MAG: phosphatidylglycerophosphatase A [Rhodospirillales bacterium]|nr:phosphatidylglycerophosphatase A [Rhodospirillales bacterium]MCB9995660.1 phosphatidylglycerophosphatase A [Rhodospirillales bacterium]
MLDKDLIAKLNMKDPAIWLATWFGCGLIKKAPGTWGTLGGLPLGVLFLYETGWPGLLAATILMAIVGYMAADRFEKSTGTHDAGAIVVDEVVGIWVTLLVTPLTHIGLILAFVLFRVFDIFKPWPVSYFDKMPGAFGVMADDVMAGLYAALCIGGLAYAGII